MSDSTESKPKEGCGMAAAKVFLVLLGLIVVLSLIGKLGGDDPPPQVTRTLDPFSVFRTCLLYTSDAADERSSGDLGGRRVIQKKKKKINNYT